eukprot:14144482-Alexandrium_andersonii.AAC.1
MVRRGCASRAKRRRDAWQTVRRWGPRPRSSESPAGAHRADRALRRSGDLPQGEGVLPERRLRERVPRGALGSQP